MEQFKSNLQSVERRISTSGNYSFKLRLPTSVTQFPFSLRFAGGKELEKDVEIAMTWIHHTEFVESTSSEWIYLNREYIPNLTRAILYRKVDTKREGKDLMKCLENVMTHSLKYLGKELVSFFAFIKTVLYAILIVFSF
jgi:hypothetical protein